MRTVDSPPARTAALAVCVVLFLGGQACGREDPGVCSGSEVQLRRESHLTVGTDLSHPPFSFRDPDTGEARGLEVDLLTALAEKMNLEVSFTDRTLSALVPDLMTRRFDVVASGFRPTEDLAGQLCLTAPVADADLGLVVRSRSAIEDVGDLEGLAVAVERATPAAEWASENLAGVRVEAHPAPEDPIDALRSGEVDAALHDLPVAVRLSGEDVRVARTIPTGQSYVFAFHPENLGLKQALDAALEAIRADGTHEQILERWLG